MLLNRSLPTTARPSSITTLDGSDLEYEDNYKHLGVWLDCKLSFLESNETSPIQNDMSQQSLLHSRCQTYPRKTDHPTDPRLRRCHLQNILQHSTQQIGCRLSQCHILPTTATSMISLDGPRFILVAKPTGSRSSTSLC